MRSTGPFQYRWLKGYIYSSFYYHHQIGSIHLSHCYHIFPWLCAWDVCYIIFTYCHLLHIRFGKTGNCFHYYFAVYDECKYSDTFWLADGTRLFVQYTISLSSLCKLIWRHWAYKMPVKNIYFVESVSKIKHIHSVIHYTIRGAVCFQFTHFPCDDWENIYTLSYYHHRIGSMNYNPLFRVRSLNNGVRCMSFYILIKSEVSTFPIIVICFRGCVSEMVVLPYSVIYYIYISGTLGPCFNYLC